MGTNVGVNLILIVFIFNRLPKFPKKENINPKIVMTHQDILLKSFFLEYI